MPSSFGIIKADTLTHSTEGSVDTKYAVSGSAKAWIEFNGTGTVATSDSLNISGLFDDGDTGKYSTTFTTNMSNAKSKHRHSDGRPCLAPLSPFYSRLRVADALAS